MTKAKIKTLLSVMQNLEEIRNKIKTTIVENVTPNDDDDLYNLLSAETESVDNTMVYLENNHYFENAKIEEGTPVNAPRFEFDPDSMIASLHIDVNDTDELILSNTVSDFGTKQASICYTYGKTDALIDIALAEIKKGELATIDNLPEDNKDIDVYVYGDPYDEDYTARTTIRYEEIASALDES